MYNVFSRYFSRKSHALGWLKVLFFFIFIIISIFIYEVLVFERYALVSFSRSSSLSVPILEIKPGMSVRTIIKQLFQTQGVGKPPGFMLELFVRYYKQGSHLKAGEYRLDPGITAKKLLKKWVSGEVLQYSLTIIEGWTVHDLLKHLEQHPQIDHQAMKPEEKPGSTLEGMFFPDTYYFPKGMSSVKFLNRAYSLLQRNLEKEWKNRDPNLVLRTPYEALVLASIIEKETRMKVEQKWVSGVFHARLKQGMRLQADPTVVYGLGATYTGKITSENLRRDTPYNTYIHPGLPPRPIALAGLAAIHAALHPQKAEPYLYFVAKGDGTHYFSKTLEEHNQAVKKYILEKNKDGQ